MKYKMLCIAYKDEQAYFFSDITVHPKDYPAIALTPINSNDLDQRLNRLGNNTQASALRKENDYFRFSALDQKRQRLNIALQELTARVARLIFEPCLNYYSSK